MGNCQDYQVVFGAVLWFTGLPSSGKTTIARKASEILDEMSVPNLILDGDEIRPIIAAGVDFSEEGRFQSLLRYIALSKIMIRGKIITMLAVNNHAKKQRDIARKAHPSNQFVEVFIDTPLDVCIKRDVKGIYDKARKGELDHVVGVSIAYETPENPDIAIKTCHESSRQGAGKIIDYLIGKKIIRPRSVDRLPGKDG